MQSLQTNTLGHDLTDLISTLYRAKRIAQNMETEPQFSGHIDRVDAKLDAIAAELRPVVDHRMVQAQIARQPIRL